MSHFELVALYTYTLLPNKGLFPCWFGLILTYVNKTVANRWGKNSEVKITWKGLFFLGSIKNIEQFKKKTASVITPNSPNKCSAWQQVHKDSLWNRPIMCCHIFTASVASLSFIHSQLYKLCLFRCFVLKNDDNYIACCCRRRRRHPYHDCPTMQSVTTMHGT